MVELNPDTRALLLTPEAIIKSDKDIETISKLNELAQKTGNILVLSGGYATEAHCGGMITRPHGDIDAHIILTGTMSPDEIFAQVQDILTKEATKWKLRDKKPDKIDYLEDDDNKAFTEKRRVEVRLNSPHERNTKYPKMPLISSAGTEIYVNVVDLTELIASKIHKLFEAKDGVDTTKDRHSSQTDYSDLKRLLNAEGFNKEAVIDYLTNWLSNSGIENANSKAQEAYNFAISLIAK